MPKKEHHKTIFWRTISAKRKKSILRKISKAHQGQKHGPCSEERKRKISLAHLGKPLSQQHIASLKAAWVKRKLNPNYRPTQLGTKASIASRKKMSESQKKVWAKRNQMERDQQMSNAHKAALENPKRKNTKLELEVQKCLKQLRLNFVLHKQIGIYNADIYLPGCRLVIECDGTWWHSLPGIKEKDKRKDKYLQSQGYFVTRIKEKSVTRAPMRAVLYALKRVWKTM